MRRGAGRARPRAGSAGGERRAARLIAVAVLAFLLFNYPFLALFDRPARVLGVPLLWGYLLAVWALVIALIARAPRP